jgi:anthranilate synthase component 2
VLLMIDNYDSFTYNLVQYFGELGADVHVYRNDKITLDEIERLAPERIVISPGPCTPNEAGISVPAIKHFAGKLPILGVCLGHQSIGQAFGGQVVRAREVMHGKTSQIHHLDGGVFKGLPKVFEATRYHSLVVARDSLPECLEMTAWTQNPDGSIDEIMGLRHKTLAVEGVQFHPESILTQHGHDLLRNFLKIN